MEPNEYEDRSRCVALGHGHVVEHWTDMGSQLISGSLGVNEVARHAVGSCEEVKIVAVIHHVVHAAGCGGLPQIHAVNISPRRSAVGGCRVVSYPHISVRGHMHEMTRGWYERFQTPGASQGPLRVWGRLHSMDVVMIRADVIGITTQHRFQHGDSLFRTFGRAAVEAPEFPGVEIHQALCVECGRVEIVWVVSGELSHRVCVLRVELPQVNLGVRRVALRQSVDVSAFAFRRSWGERQRSLYRFVCSLFVRGIDVEINAWTQCQRYTPKRHG